MTPDTNLITDLVSTLIGRDVQGPLFQKRGPQREVQLLRRAAKVIAGSLKDSVDSLCALATSGIAFSVFLAKELDVPVFFYRSRGWPLGNLLFRRVALDRVPGSRCLLVDTHVRRGWTSSTAADTISRYYRNLQIVGIVTLLEFDPQPLDWASAPSRYSVVPIASAVEYIREQLEVDDEQYDVNNLAKPDNPFWRLTRQPTGIGENPSRRKHWSRHQVKSLTDPHIVEYPSLVGEKLERYVPTDDQGIWKLYLYSDLIAATCEEFDRHMRISNYDALVGVNALGTALASELACHTEFAGPVLTHYDGPRLEPDPGDDLKGKRVLMCQTRMLTGHYTLAAYNAIGRYGAICQDLVVARLDQQRERWNRQQPLRNLASTGIHIHTLRPR